MAKMPEANVLCKSKLRAAVWDKTAGRCWYCGKQTNPWRTFCIDHVVNDGPTEIANLVPCCRLCNRRKCNRGLVYLRECLWKASQPVVKVEPDYEFYFEQLP